MTSIQPLPVANDRRRRLTITVAAAVLVLSMVVVAGSWRFGSFTAALDALSGFRLLVDSDAKSVGAVEPSGERVVAFQLSNRSDRPILLLGSQVSCSCLRGKPLPITIPSGGSRPYEVRFHAKPKLGIVAETLTLFTDDPQRPRLVLKVEGRVVDAPGS